MYYWLIPAAITLWLTIWAIGGYLFADSLAGHMRGIGGILIAGACWLIWFLLYGIHHFQSI